MMVARAHLQETDRMSGTSRHSRRLNALREEAAAIRRRHMDGDINAVEAASMLNELKKKYLGFFERILDL